MKKKIMFLTAVLLLVVLLFFLKKKGVFQREEDLPVTPTPEVTEPHTLKNAWIISSTENSITFFFDGKEQTVSTKGKVQKELASCVGDLTVLEDTVLSLMLKPDKVTAKVLRVDDTGMELEGYGVLPLAEGFKVYRLYDGVKEEPTGKVLVGSSDNEFVLENGRICASLLRKEPDLEKIRVLIGTEGYRGYYHTTVEVTADCGYTVSCGEKKESFEAGEICTFTKEDFEADGERRVIVTEDGDGKIRIRNLKRSGGNPAYRGTLEIAGRPEGLLVVNEVTMEEYLYAVLPSEMPSSFGKEALKAQAICARSYAYTELMANRYAQYGAHVDDSVSCQVYNNIGETKEAVLAVKETHGQVLLHEGEIAQCYYFSTSCGHTTSAADVWENAEEASYLTGKLHKVKIKGEEEPEEPTVHPEVLNIETDDEMTRFLKETTKTYDSDSPWYRWQTFLELESLGDTVESALKTRYDAVPEQILTYDEEADTFVSLPIRQLGTIESIRVFERGKGGIATRLLIAGSNGVFLVKNEYNIRSVLAPVETAIYRKNGDSVNGAALLPSGFIVLQKGTFQGKTGYLVTGGGYGHGVGLSQCGADAMAQYGFSCEEIIEEYYPGTEIGFIYN